MQMAAKNGHTNVITVTEPEAAAEPEDVAEPEPETPETPESAMSASNPTTTERKDPLWLRTLEGINKVTTVATVVFLIVLLF